MSTALLLAVIYLAFIGLGLPDSLLGAAWPAAHTQLNADVSWAGALAVMTAVGTVISSLSSEKLIRRFGTGTVSAVSIGLTAAALFAVSRVQSFAVMLLLAIPLGLGGGSVDSALNNYVALNFRASHMNWLHCFWGVGATCGPLVTAAFIARGQWRGAYGTISLVLALIALTVALSFPLWKKKNAARPESDARPEKCGATPKRVLLGLPGAKYICLAFFVYCAAETSTGLWASSYFVYVKGAAEDAAAAWSSLFFFGITAGRLLSGFAALRFSDATIVRAGEALMILGAALMPVLPGAWSAAALLLAGLGCAPVFPSLLDETPELFGKAYSQGMMGLQLAFAYMGSTLMAPLFGVISKMTGFWPLPLYVLALGLILVLASERCAKKSVTR